MNPICVGVFVILALAAGLSARGKSRIYQLMVGFVLIAMFLFGGFAVIALSIN